MGRGVSDFGDLQLVKYARKNLQILMHFDSYQELSTYNWWLRGGGYHPTIFIGFVQSKGKWGRRVQPPPQFPRMWPLPWPTLLLVHELHNHRSIDCKYLNYKSNYIFKMIFSQIFVSIQVTVDLELGDPNGIDVCLKLRHSLFFYC